MGRSPYSSLGLHAARGEHGSINRTVTGPDLDTLSRFPGWSRLVEFYCTIPRECTKGPHLKEK